MKLTAPYFGNRFATVAKKKTTKARKTTAVSEMEALEPRILLSGITGGSKKSVTFFDADGDKVTVKLQGAGSFNVDLGGNSNNSDAANITINPDKTGVAGSLGVVVTPVGSFTKPVQTKVIYNPNGVESDFAVGGVGNLGNGGISQKIATQFYDLTPGFTNIGSITVAAGTTQVGSIGLNAAIVPVIDLSSAAAGNINLSTGMVAKVDQLMATNTSFQPDRPAWVPNIGKIDLFDISAGSIAGINISSVGTDNDFNGDIVATTGGIGRITGTNADFNGTISLLGTQSALGNIVVNSFSSSAVITAAGDLTFNAAGYGGLLDVAGHLNLSLIGNSAFTGTIIADGGISGLNASTTDTILVNGVDIGAAYDAGPPVILGNAQIITKGDMADIVINNATLYGALDAKNIGTIHFGANSNLDGAVILATEDLGGLVTRDAGLNLNNATIVVGDTVGLIDVAGGNLQGSITAANFTQITVRGGNMDADVLATSSIGDVTVTDGSITGSLIAQGAAGIGAISAISFDNGNAVVDGGAIIGATIYSAGGIKSITATTTDTNSPAIGITNAGVNTNISALGTVGAITATSFGAGGTAIQGLTFIAPTISGVTANAPFGVAMAGTNTFISTTGSIGNITATGLNGGINGSTTLNSATTVGSISGTALSGNVPGTNDGISGLVINAQTGISTVTGKAFGGDGIGAGSKFYSLTGNIEAISGSSTSMSGSGDGINGLEVNAIAGSVADITGSASGLSATAHGMNDVNVDALTGIGTITGTAIYGNGINKTAGSSFEVTGEDANITAVVAKTSTGIAINGATFSAVGGTISSISANPTGAAGRAINGASFTAEFLGPISVTVSNLDGGYAINDSSFTAIAGAIGDITVVNKSLGTNNPAYGIGGNSNFTATNGIGDISVTVAANNTGGTVAAIQDKADGAANRPDFNADSDGDGTGNIDSVSVITTGSGIAGISGATFTAEDVTGNFSVAMNGLNAGDAINKGNNVGAQLTVLDLAGDLGGNISVVNSSLNAASDGLDDVKLDIAGNVVGTTTITAAAGAAMNNSAIDPVDMGAITLSGDAGAMINTSSILVTGEIAGLTVTGDITTGSSITAESFAATNKILITGSLGGTITSETSIGEIEVTGDMSGTIETDDSLNVTSTGGSIGKVTIGGVLSGDITATADTPALATIGVITIGEGIDTTPGATAISADGAVTSITVSSNGIANGKINVASVGALSVTGDVDDTITTTVGGITSITVLADPTATGGAQDGDVNANIISETTIGAINIAGDLVTGKSITATDDIGDVTITGDFAGSIISEEGDVATAAGENITVGTVSGATVTAGVVGTVAGNIGDIVINGDLTVDQTITLNAYEDTGVGGVIGDVTATGFSVNNKSLDITVGVNAVEIGSIQVDNADAGENANFSITGGAALTTIGAVSVDGALTLPTLTTVQTVSTITAGTILGGSTVGNGLAGSSIGLITIGSGVAAANSVTFDFASFRAVNSAGAGGAGATTVIVDFLTGAGPDLTAADALPVGVGTVSPAGVTVFYAV